ncbi:hypothetical protein [Gilvimarinus sp. DA14]|uniref:hypothetical protein n=1 Tax=Gilvimarinus sp. DA14 TaxID=2956798 RepID=UPI0020B6AFA4|nr:hypothetical protein [Gilvimarinus sp. DA14]UTF59473.1 hypothetical protein NHM04_13480 [Gilvimarinus sp. DA14]
MLQKVVLLVLGLLACCLVQASSKGQTGAAAVPEYVLWVGGNAPGRAEHEVRVIREALERTRSDFGGYRLEVSSDPSIAGRWRQHLAQGETIHIVPTSYTDFPPEEITLIPVPVAGGRLGYRNLVVLKDRLAEFGRIKSRSELSRYTAGQGITWPDMWVYEANELPILGADELPQLFALLRSEDIDYIPLGVEETESILEHYTQAADEFAVVPELLIYYPLSSFPVVSNQQPELITRLKAGLEAMHADGSLPLDIGQGVEKPRQCRVIKLENPSRIFPLL